MNIRVEQQCPQCAAPVTLSESDHLLACPYCGVKNFMFASSSFRYVLPGGAEEPEDGELLYAPYVRFKGTVFLISEKGITHRVIDTTQAGCPMPGLPLSLGVRPQAMSLSRLTPETPGRFLRLTVKAKVILEKAAQLSTFFKPSKSTLYHQAYIGETLSFIYLPLIRKQEMLFDSIIDAPIANLEKLAGYPLKGSPFNSRWLVRFLSTLCPRCGWSLDGEGDCLVMTCSNCDTAWALGDRGLKQVQWQMVSGDRNTSLYLAFWKISAHVPVLDIYSFADFIQRTNQPMIPKQQWHERVMSFWVPAFKLSPKIFLQAGRQATIGQCRLHPEEGHVVPDLYPVTLPASEAGQSVKLMLAASTASRKNIFPYLPRVKLKDAAMKLVFLPFADKGHDWFQPQTGTVIAKNVLRLGRSL